MSRRFSPQREMELTILARMQCRGLSAPSALKVLGVSPRDFHRVIRGDVEPAVYAVLCDKLSLCANLPADELHRLYLKVQNAKNSRAVRPQIFRNCPAIRPFICVEKTGIIEEEFET